MIFDTPARAAEISNDLKDAIPEQAREFLDNNFNNNINNYHNPAEFSAEMGQVFDKAGKLINNIIRERVKNAAKILLAVIFCGAARGMARDEITGLVLNFTGALSVAALSAGSLDDFIGLGWRTIGDLNLFSGALFPALAAASAASGAVTGSAVRHITAVFLARIMIDFMDGFFMPMIYLYIGLITASCASPGNQLAALADGLKKAMTGILTAMLLLFTVYLSVFHVIAGTADSAAVKTARAAVSHVIPVVGGIIADASEAILAGAGLLKGAIGAFGALVIFAACLSPFLRLGIEYLLYKIISFFASVTGAPELSKLLDGLSGAFGLILGMTGSCALLLLIAVLSFVSASAP